MKQPVGDVFAQALTETKLQPATGEQLSVSPCVPDAQTPTRIKRRSAAATSDAAVRPMTPLIRSATFYWNTAAIHQRTW